MNKIFKFLKSKTFQIALLISATILTIIILVLHFFPRKVNSKIVNGIEKIQDKIQDKQTDLKIENVKNNIERNIKIEHVEQQKDKLNTELVIISKIPNKRKRLEEMIKFHDKIKGLRNEIN